MKSCSLTETKVVRCELYKPDWKETILTIPALKEDCKDEIVFIKRLIRENRLVRINTDIINNSIYNSPLKGNYYEITITYSSRDGKIRTLIF